MTRLHSIITAVYLLTILTACQQRTGDSQDNNTEDPPNIVFILSDDQSWTDYSFMGHPHIETPRLDQLANESLTFTRGYATAPVCRPSLASIVTGLYPHQHGVTGNDPVFDYTGDGPKYSTEWLEQRWPKNKEIIDKFQQHPALPGLLKQKGYRSLQSGKWWEGQYTTGGFTDGMTLGDPASNGRHGDAGLKIGREGMEPVLDFLDEVAADQTPFFLWYAPFLPHTPHNPPDSLYQKYRTIAPSEPIARYWAMCEWFDQTVGTLLDGLEERGMKENTLVVFVSDNGWIQDPDGSGFLWRSKQSPYDLGIRTPIMYRWPGHIQPRIDTTTLASSTDMVVTALAAAGLSKTDEMPGVNVRDSSALENRKAIFSEDFHHDIQELGHPASSLEHRMIVHSLWKLILPARDHANHKTHSSGDGRLISVIGQEELYQIIHDPYETKNIATDHPEVVKALKEQVEAWWGK